jgi:hypothetical protein
MRALVLALFLASCCPSTPPPQTAAKADRKLTGEDRTRFLAAAVFEGLHEDGPDPKIFESILKNRDQHFVVKCPTCNPVAGAIEGYVAFCRICTFPYEGKGFPAEIKAGLGNSARAVRLKAIEAMVDRYVTRHLEQVVMTDGEKASMKSWLIMGKKFGMSVKGEEFGDFCPSCEGATKK